MIGLKREGGRYVLVLDRAGGRALAAAIFESEGTVPMGTVALPADSSIAALRVVADHPAKPGRRHVPIPGAELGNPERESMP